MATEAERSHNLLPINWSSGEPVGWGFYLNPETQELGAWCPKRSDDVHSPRWVMINLHRQLLRITMETGCILRVYLRGCFQSDGTAMGRPTLMCAASSHWLECGPKQNMKRELSSSPAPHHCFSFCFLIGCNVTS